MNIESDIALSGAANLSWRSRRRSTVRVALLALLVAVLYYAGVHVAFAARLPNSSFSPLWAPIALLLAVLLLTPLRYWWLWMLAMIATHLVIYLPLGYPLPRQALQMLHNLLIVALPAFVLRRWAPKAIRLASFSDMLRFLVVVIGAGLLVPLLSAALYVATGFSTSFWLIWQLIAFSNILAYLTLLPALLLVFRYGLVWLRQATQPQVMEAGILAVLLLLIGQVVFGLVPDDPISGNYTRAVALPLLLWAAVRFGPGGLSLALTALTGIAIWNAANGFGPFASSAPNQNVLNLPSYFLTFAVPLMLLAALMADRRRAEAALTQLNAQLEDRVNARTAERRQVEESLRRHEERYRWMFESSLDAIVITDENDTYLQVNDAAAKLFAVPREELLGRRGIDLSSRSNPHAEAEYQDYLERGYDRGEFTFQRPDGTQRIAEYAAARIGPQLHQAILRDITDQKAAAAELERARQAAETANRAKSEFVAHISHEIRTPMNAVLGLATLLLNSSLTSAQRDDVETIQRSGAALLTLIDDILDLSKIEAGKLTLDEQPFALRECAEQALDLIAALVDAKQLELRYVADPAVPHAIIGDEARLRQILVNLLSNAVRFTESGTITLEISGMPQAQTLAGPPRWALSIAVRDTGIGIEPAHLTRIFQQFVQINTAPTGHTGGSGLGLTISRRLAEAMGGQIQVTSTPGAGSVFTVELVATIHDAPPPAYMASQQPVLAGKHALVFAAHAADREALLAQFALWGMMASSCNDSAMAVTLARTAPVDVVVMASDGALNGALVSDLRAACQNALPIIAWTAVSQRSQMPDTLDTQRLELLSLPIRPSLLHSALLRSLDAGEPLVAQGGALDLAMAGSHPLRILLAEDNVTNQQVAQRLLAKLGYQADIAADGLALLEALRRQSYDLVLMDVQMPEISGTEATRYIRAFWPAERQPRIAAMTAYASDENRDWLLHAGMDDYIRKPVRLEDLVRVLRATRPTTSDQHREPQERTPFNQEHVAAFIASISQNDPVDDAAFLDAYLADIALELQQLTTASANGESATARRAAHTVAGLCLQLGALDLAILAGRIETALCAGAWQHDTALLHQAEAAYAELRQALHPLARAHGAPDRGRA